ncbi:fibronectin type III domain-containing protein 4-like isoform X1 [Takifugu flavidus]|uniref:fibronectin type III domain-containing protein 4-like isoform X1 n=1 Tax=Takifugu flavidus TaxID=433684 RepID=UPI002544933A|nr:fibronectin type III domain-containing protein 4-like isoform X1 [Takifugu flavidus]
MSASALLEPGLLLLLLLPLSCWTVGATVPAAPVNVSVTQLRSKSALVTWNVPQGDTVIGYSISQQRQDGLMQRSIREVNTSSHRCALWDLDEDTHYSVQVQSIGPHGDSQPSAAVHFRTLEKTDYPAGVLEHRNMLPVNMTCTHDGVQATTFMDVCVDEPAMEGLSPHLQTGELLIITTVLLLWAAVIALFCRQYDIIKDSESTSTKEKTKRPLGHTPAASFYHTSASGSPVFQNGAVPGSRVTQSTQTFHQSPGNACYHSSAAFKSCSRGEQVL